MQYIFTYDHPLNMTPSTSMSLVTTDGLASVKIRINTRIELVQDIALMGAGSVGRGTGSGSGGSVRATVITVGINTRVGLVGRSRGVRAGGGRVGAMGALSDAMGSVSTMSPVSPVSGSASVQDGASSTVRSGMGTVVSVRIDAGVNLVGDVLTNEGRGW